MLIKLKFQFPEIVIGILLSISLFVLGAMYVSSSQSPSNQQDGPAKGDSDSKTKTDNAKTKSLWAPSEPIDLYTLLLTGFTGVLAIVSIFQGVLLLRADKTARITAEAAMLSAKAAIAIELPLIKMSLNDLSKGSTIKNGIRIEKFEIHFVTFTNLGRTRAFPVELRYGFAVGTLPEKPQYNFVDPFQYDDILEAPLSKEFKKYLSGSYVVTDEMWRDVSRGKLPVWFFCELAYLDFMQDKERTAAYCWRGQYSDGRMNWRPDDTPAYNH